MTKGKNKDKDPFLRILEGRGYTPQELERILKSIEAEPPRPRMTFEDYFEKKTTIGIFADTHIGAHEFDEPLFRHMANVFRKRDVSRIYQAGDILEGMSTRPGHIYDLSQIGFSQQMGKAEEMFNLLKQWQVFGIDGNHDEWYLKKADQGVIVGEELQKRCPNYHHLGSMEADVKIHPNIILRLFHPGDGSAYATSYKLQKLMESITGGQKPEILIEGHYHKALYMFNRNIHGLEAGTIMGQNKWMRSKKIAANKGFWVVDIEFGKGGIGSFGPTFYPGYK